jgi:hypothetical protein
MAQITYRRNKLNVFFIFLICATLLSLLIKLSETHASAVVFKTQYVNIPDDKLLVGEPKKEISLYVDATGFKLLGYYFIKQTLDISLNNVKTSRGKSYLDKESLLPIIDQQLSRNVKLRSVIDDTLYFNFDVNAKKIVNVEPRVTLHFLENYKTHKGLQVEPKEVTISGPESQVANINVLYTEEQVLENVNKDFSLELPVILPEHASEVSLSNKTVSIKAQVERYSEKIFKVPIVVLNKPKGTEVKTFPSEVQIVCKAPVNILKKITAKEFRVTCNYQETIRDNINFMIPKINHKPADITDIRLVEEKVEFIIRRL